MFLQAQNHITRGFWGDEAWTSLISQLPFQQMLKTTAADFHPPAFYTVIELWYKIFPTTEVSTRAVSVIFYLLTGFLVFKLVSFISTSRESKPFDKSQDKPTLEVIRKGRFWALLSAFIVLVNPIFFQYAFEARNYTMFAFAATGSIYFLIKIIKSTSRESEPTLEVIRVLSHGIDSGQARMTWTYVGFVLFSALGIYTHYYMFFTLAAQGLYLILFDRKILLKMIWLYAAVGVLYLPWIPFLASQVSSVGQSYWIGGIDQRTHYEAILRILGGEQQSVLRTILFWLSVVLVLTGLVQHIRPVRQRLEPQALSGGQKSFEKPYILVWLWATVPFILASLPGFRFGEVQFPFRPIFFWRYLIPAAVPLAMVIVHASQKLWQPLRTLSLVVIIILSLIIDIVTFVRYPKTFKQVYAERIVPEIEPNDKIVTVLPSFAEVLYYRNRSGLTNELIILTEGLVQFSGKSLLDAYARNGVVMVGDRPSNSYFELRPGPSVVKVESQSFDETQDDTE